MKYKFLTALLLIFSFWSEISIAQTIRIISTNPIPRKNQAIELEYFYSNSEFENRFDAYIDNAGENNLLSGTIKISESSNTNSQITIGPIEIKYNGMDLKSDSFKIEVFDKLPDVNNGIWINQINIEGSQFIIIEQRIPRSMNGEKFTNFNRNAFLKLNVDPFELNSHTFSFQSNEESIEKDEYTERRTVLLIRQIENLKNDMKINESFFSDLPENHEPIKLILRKK